MSAPYSSDDVEFDAIPAYVTTPEDIAKLTGKNFFPRDKRNLGFDWCRFEFCKKKGVLIAILNENKFSRSLDSTSNKINFAKDIVKKCKDAKAAFVSAGWPEEQIVFRLAAHRSFPEFRQSTLTTLPSNCIIYGPEELIQLFPATVKVFFDSMKDIDGARGL